MIALIIKTKAPKRGDDMDPVVLAAYAFFAAFPLERPGKYRE